MEGFVYLFLIFISVVIFYTAGDYCDKSVALSMIWVYNVDTKSLVEGAPFKTKSSCARALSIDRHTISSYIDSNKILKHQWVFSSVPLDLDTLFKFDIPSTVWEALVGNLLGDGAIIEDYVNKNSRIEFTFAVKHIEYIKHLKEVAYASICTTSAPTPYPNKPGVEPTQFWFAT